MKAFSLPALPGRLGRGATRQARQRAEAATRLLGQLRRRALDALLDGLRTEVERGHLRLVLDLLADRALPAARALLLERVAARLLVRLGLRGAFVGGLAGWVLPLLLEKLVKVARDSGLLARLEAHPTVAETLLRLEDLRRAAARRLFPDGDTGAEEVE